MEAHIFIHACGEIVESFDIEFDFISEIQELLDYARSKYGSSDGFCFSCMIL